MTRPHVVIMLVVVLAALALRLGVVAAIPNFFASADPTYYYAAARGCLHYGVPRIAFIWHFATSPPEIAHLEDYCEPAFAYLLAVPMGMLGGGVVAAKMLSVVCGTALVLIVYRFALRIGRAAAVLAAALVAFEPWSIYYGGLIMKEAAVSVVVVLYVEAIRRLLALPDATRARGVAAGLLTVGASLFQYELLPILATATAVSLGIHQRRLLWPYLAGTTAAALALLAVTWGLLGVPISAKLYYFVGRSFWDPLAASSPPDLAAMASRFLPLESALSALVGWYPVLLVLALLGARESRIHRTEFTLLAAFGVSYLYFHAVPGHLWPRHLIPATAVFASYAAIGISALQGWLTRAWAPAVTIGLLGFALVAPRAYALADSLTPGDAFAPPWAAPAILAAGVGLPLLAVLVARRRLPLARVKWALPPLLALALALNYHASLPWPAIYGNPQMPGHERLREQRERVCRQIRVILAGAPVMTIAPAEVNLYTGSPAVVLPDSPAGIRKIQARYRTPYLLVRAGVLKPGVIEQIPVEPVLQVEDHTLYRFVDAPEGPAEAARASWLRLGRPAPGEARKAARRKAGRAGMSGLSLRWWRRCGGDGCSRSSCAGVGSRGRGGGGRKGPAERAADPGQGRAGRRGTIRSLHDPVTP